MSEFDLQDYLMGWRQEQRHDLMVLNTRIMEIDARISGHHARIAILENISSAVKWLTVTVVGAVIAAVIGYFRHG